MSRRKKLKQLISSKEILVIPGAYDALSAKLVEASGFHAVYMTGYGQSASKLGEPDVGLMTMSEMVERAKDMVMAVHVPVIADGDTGFGGVVNVVRTVREYERVGVAGIQLEDQVIPKKCGHMLGRQVVPVEEMLAKIEAAKATRTDPDFVIIARTDARTVHGIDEAIRRAKLFEEAGADVVFVESVESVAEMRMVNEAVNIPSIANMVEGGRTPYLTAQELEDVGYQMVVYPVATLYAAAQAVNRAVSCLKQDGNMQKIFDRGDMMDFADFNKLVGLERIQMLDANAMRVLSAEDNDQTKIH